MEKKHDNLEELFRKSLEKYSVPGLRPWEEERKIVEERKKKRQSRRPGSWMYFLIAGLMLGSLGYWALLGLKDQVANTTDSGEKSADSVAAPVFTVPEKSSAPVFPDDAQQKGSPLVTDALKKNDASRLPNFAAEKASPLATVEHKPALPIHPNGGADRVLPVDGKSQEQRFVQNEIGRDLGRILGIFPLTGQAGIKNQNSLRPPGIVRWESLCSQSPASLPFRHVSIGLLLGIDNLVLARNHASNVEFVSSGFHASPSVSLSGIFYLSPRLMIRSGVNVHRFREELNVEVNKIVVDTVYAVKEKLGTDDITVTQSTRELSFKSSSSVSNSYTAIALPVSVGYQWPVGRGSVAVFTGFLANFFLRETAVSSAGYSLGKSFVSDYRDGMDPDLEGYVHYNQYAEYTSRVDPIESKVAPLSFMFDARIMGRLPLHPNLDLAAEVSYARGISPFLEANSTIRPSLVGAKIGLLYRWK